MKKLTKALLEVNHIEQLSQNCSIIHQLNPLFKLLTALIFIICILSVPSYHLSELLIYMCLVFLLIKISRLPMKSILSRTWVGLPFSLCLGLSNLILMRDIVHIGNFVITTGILSFLMIMLKTFLTLSIVFILIATTGFDALACELVHIKIPSVFVLQLVMTYRYIFLLVEEASQMTKAYMLRNPGKKGIEMKDMGSFLGGLLIRSFHRSQDIYQCMVARGFKVNALYVHYQPFEIENVFLLIMVIGFFMIIKVVCL